MILNAPVSLLEFAKALVFEMWIPKSVLENLKNPRSMSIELVAIL
jgi:hypothetical protein